MPTFDAIRQRFGEGVAQIVADFIDAWSVPKPAWRVRKEAYVAKLLLVSLPHKTHNAEAIPFDYRFLGETHLSRIAGGADGTRWYYQTLAEFFSRAMPGGLSDDCRARAQNFHSREPFCLWPSIFVYFRSTVTSTIHRILPGSCAYSAYNSRTSKLGHARRRRSVMTSKPSPAARRIASRAVVSHTPARAAIAQRCGTSSPSDTRIRPGTGYKQGLGSKPVSSRRTDLLIDMTRAPPWS